MNTAVLPNDPHLQAAVEQVMCDFAGRGYFPSAVVHVFNRAETLCTAVLGPVTVDTVYDVASVSKIATSTQVLLAIEEGKFRLEDAILDVLPGLSNDALLRERLVGVTVFRLLTHTSTIADWYPFYAETGDFAHVLHIALSRTAPVEGMVYSDLNFMLLGKLLEATYGMPLDQCLQENLVRPLSLGRMTYHPSSDWDIAPSCYGNPIEEEMCRERGISFAGWRPHEPVIGQANDGNAYYYYGGVAGSAGVFADAAAYENLCRFYMNTDSPLLLSAQEEHAPTRGLGLQVSDMYPEGCGHTGFTGTSIYFSRKLNIGVVAFTNRLFFKEKNTNMTNDFRRALHRAVVGLL